MKKKLLFTLLAFTSISLLIQCNAFSQVNLEWVKYNSGNPVYYTRNDIIKTDVSGKTYIGGVYLNGTENRNFILQYNPDGSAGPVYWTANQMQPSCYWIDKFFNTYAGGYYNQGTNKYLNTFKCSPRGFIWEVKDTVFGYGPYEVVDITSDNAGNAYMLRFKGLYYIYKYRNDGSCFRFPLTGIPEAVKITIDSRNNDIILACYETEIREGHIIKYDSNFTLKWDQQYYSPGNITKIICTPSGKIFTLDDVFGITCFDSSGSIKWSYAINGISYDMITDNDENPVVASSNSTMKFRSDSAGTIWRDNHRRYKLCNGKNNDVYTLNPSKGRINVSKISRTGAIFWNYEFERAGSGNDSALSISADSSSNVYITGYSNDGADTRGIILKLSQNYCSVSGIITTLNGGQNINNGYVKAVQYNPTSDEVITADSTIIQPNGSYILNYCPVENVYIFTYNEYEIVPTYYDTSIYWQYADIVHPPGNPDSINVDAKNLVGPKGRFHISGAVSTLEPTPHKLKDAVAYAKLGNAFKGYCITDLNVYGNLYIDSLPPGLYQLIVTRPGYNTVIKEIYLMNTNATALITLKSILPVSKEISRVPESFTLYQNYPNPFNPSTTISFDIPKSSDVKIIIYDITGRIVTELVNERMAPGSYKAQWNASVLSSGIYLYQLITDDYIESKRMVLIK